MESRPPKAYLLFLLARREYSRYELFQKLKTRGVSEPEADELLEYFIEQNWQSDLRFAEAFCRSQLSKYRGPNRIYQAILPKGVDKEIYQEALDNLDINWYEVIEDCYQKKYRNDNNQALTFEDRQKRIKYLLGQGFSFDLVKEVMD